MFSLLRTQQTARLAFQHIGHGTSPRVYSTVKQIEMTTVADTIRAKVEAALQPTKVDVVDDTWKHAGHAGTKGLRSAETHFTLTVVTHAFEGVPLVKRHQQVYSLLKEELEGGVHALSLNLKTPAEVAPK